MYQVQKLYPMFSDSCKLPVLYYGLPLTEQDFPRWDLQCHRESHPSLRLAEAVAPGGTPHLCVTVSGCTESTVRFTISGNSWPLRGPLKDLPLAGEKQPGGGFIRTSSPMDAATAAQFVQQVQTVLDGAYCQVRMAPGLPQAIHDNVSCTWGERRRSRNCRLRKTA